MLTKMLAAFFAVLSRVHSSSEIIFQRTWLVKIRQELRFSFREGGWEVQPFSLPKEWEYPISPNLAALLIFIFQILGTFPFQSWQMLLSNDLYCLCLLPASVHVCHHCLCPSQEIKQKSRREQFRMSNFFPTRWGTSAPEGPEPGRVLMLAPISRFCLKYGWSHCRFQRDENPVAGCSGNGLMAVNKWCTASYIFFFPTDNTWIFLQITHKTHFKNICPRINLCKILPDMALAYGSVPSWLLRTLLS